MKEARAALGVGRHSLRRLIAEKRLRAVRAGRRVLIDPASVRQFVAGDHQEIGQ
jgi:excisionase family DNA binding protein